MLEGAQSSSAKCAYPHIFHNVILNATVTIATIFFPEIPTALSPPLASCLSPADPAPAALPPPALTVFVGTVAEGSVNEIGVIEGRVKEFSVG